MPQKRGAGVRVAGKGCTVQYESRSGVSARLYLAENPVYAKHAAGYRDYRQRGDDILYAQEMCQFSNAIFSALFSPTTDTSDATEVAFMKPSSIGAMV